MLKILVAGQIEALPENLRFNTEFHKSHWMFSEDLSNAMHLFDLHDPEIILVNLNFDKGQGIDLIQCIEQYGLKYQTSSPEIWVTSHSLLAEEIVDYLHTHGVTRIFSAEEEDYSHTLKPAQFLVTSYA